MDLGAIALICLGMVGALWLATRPMRNGTFGHLWGMPDDDEAREEMERMFPGSADAGTEEGADRARSD